MRTKLLAVPFALALLFGITACGDDNDDSVGDTIENTGDDARDTADDATDDASDTADDASDTGGGLVDDVGDAIDGAAQSAVETAARNMAAMQGKDEFSSNGVEVDGDLDCEADADDDKGAVEITCTGTGTEGQGLTLEGTTSEMPGASLTELEGEFTGTADGDEVFSVDTLGG